MKKIPLAFISCFIVTAFLPIESFAAVKMDKPENSRHYTGVMQDLVRKNRERRKAFNKQKDTAQNTKKIDAILKDRKRVSTRPASDTEKDDILKLLMATAITDPFTLPTTMTTDLDAAKSSTDPLDRHCYIVDMAGSFARELMRTGRITSDFATFQAFSGVDQNRFLKLFYQVKGNHRIGLKMARDIEKLAKRLLNSSDHEDTYWYKSSLSILIEIAKKTDGHSQLGEAVGYLSDIAKSASKENTRKAVVDALTEIANDGEHSQNDAAVYGLGQIAASAKHEHTHQAAFQVLIKIANDKSHPKNVKALNHLADISKNEKNKGTRQAAFDVLIMTKNDKSHPGNVEVLSHLGHIAQNGEHEDTRQAAYDFLISIAENSVHSQQGEALGWLREIAQNGKHEDTRQAALGALTYIEKAEGHP